MDLKSKLLESGYTESQAMKVLEKLSKVNSTFNDGIQSWATSGKVTEYVVEQVSTTSLMNAFGLSYPAAILTVDWVKRDPQKALEAIERGIK